MLAVFGDVVDDAVVVLDVALGHRQPALAGPPGELAVVLVIQARQRVFWEPEPPQHVQRTAGVFGFEQDAPRGQVELRAEVHAAPSDTARQLLTTPPRIHPQVTGRRLIQVHRHPPRGLPDPLVQAELAETVLAGGVVLRLQSLLAERLQRQEVTQRGVGVTPVRLIPRVRLIRGVTQVHERARVPVGVISDALHLVVHPRREALRVVARGRRCDHERLAARTRTHAGTHRVPQVPLGPRQDLVSGHARRVRPQGGLSVSRNRHIERVGFRVDDALHVRAHLQTTRQHRRQLHHPRRHIEHQAGLLAVTGTPEDLRGLFAISDEQVQHDASLQLTFPVFSPELDPRHHEPAHIRALLDRPHDLTEQRAKDVLVLPRGRHERGSRVPALGVHQNLGEKRDHMIGALLAVVVPPLTTRHPIVRPPTHRPLKRGAGPRHHGTPPARSSSQRDRSGSARNELRS